MHKISKAALLAALCLAPGVAFAETVNTDDTIVVTASRSGDGVRRDLLGSSVSLFSAEDLEERQVRTVTDLLRDAPGAAVSAPPGGVTSVRLRGAEANHTLVLIDGMDASDPFQGEFDFSSLIADDVARVEVLRGQQSALYGSDAIGGVIHYITLSGREAPGLSGRMEGGSFGTRDASVRIAGATERLEGAVSASALVTKGTDIALEGDENDGFQNTTFAARGSIDVASNFRLSATARRVNSGGEFDGGFPFPTDATTTAPHYNFDALYGLARADLSLFGGAWTQALVVQHADAERRTHGDGYVSFTDGDRFKASYETAVRFGGATARNTITGAVDYREETFQDVSPPDMFSDPSQFTKRDTDQTGIVVAYDLSIGNRFGFGIAERYDHNSRFDDSSTYRIQTSYRITDSTRVRAATGTGVKNPTNYELFGFAEASFTGNPNLKPEKSTGWEIGLDQTLFGDVELGLTYFNAELKDEIATVGPFFNQTAINLSTPSEQEGVEATLTGHLSDHVRFDIAYTYLEAEQNGVEEVRRPMHSGSAGLYWRSTTDHIGAGLIARYSGETRDGGETLDAFTLVNIVGDVSLTDRVQLFGRIENALDEDYEQVLGYNEPGRAAYVGIRYRPAQ